MAGTIFGLIYLYFEYRASMLMWPSGLFMASFYVYIFSMSGFYSGAAINVYYIIMGIYGWLVWHKKTQESGTLRNMRNPVHYALVVASVAILWGALSLILKQTDSTVFIVDAINHLAVPCRDVDAHATVCAAVDTADCGKRDFRLCLCFCTALFHRLHVYRLCRRFHRGVFSLEKNGRMRHYLLPRKNLTPDAIIVANGQFPTHPVPLSLLETGGPVVCCDGAIEKASQCQCHAHHRYRRL